MNLNQIEIKLTNSQEGWTLAPNAICFWLSPELGFVPNVEARGLTSVEQAVYWYAVQLEELMVDVRAKHSNQEKTVFRALDLVLLRLQNRRCFEELRSSRILAEPRTALKSTQHQFTDLINKLNNTLDRVSSQLDSISDKLGSEKSVWESNGLCKEFQL